MLKEVFKNTAIIGVILILVLAGGFVGYKNLTGKKNQTRYILSEVKKGEIVVFVSGSGQILSEEQIDIKPKISGTVSEIFVKEGQEVKKGELLIKLDDSDFQKAVRDAEKALEAAKIELEKLLSPPDPLNLLQAENALAQAKEAKERVEDALNKAYDNSFNVISGVFLELPSIIEGVKNILFSYDFSFYQQNIDYYTDSVKIYDEKALQYRQDVYDKYWLAKNSYDQNFQDYTKASRFSDQDFIESLIDETQQTVKIISEAVKSANDLIQLYHEELKKRDLKPEPLSNTHLTNLSNYTLKLNTHLSNLLSIQRSIEDGKNALNSAERAVKERELALTKLIKGPDELDIRAKKLLVEQKEDNLATAKENLEKCYIKAPFDGVVTHIKVKKEDSVSPATILLTLITKQKIAQITLNEVDAAKVKPGQKATLTFDAIPDLTLTGQVSEIETLGTVSQGVVSFGVKIVLDSDDERIKPGMSVTAEIVVDAKSDVLVLPNNAIKSERGVYYVELVEIPQEKKKEFLNKREGVILKTPPKRKEVQIGISNDSLTEIVSGLKEGDIIVSSAIIPTQTFQRIRPHRIPGL